MTSYKYTGPVDSSVEPDLSKVKGKSAIVTGGRYYRTKVLRYHYSDINQVPVVLEKHMLKLSPKLGQSGAISFGLVLMLGAISP